MSGTQRYWWWELWWFAGGNLTRNITEAYWHQGCWSNESIRKESCNETCSRLKPFPGKGTASPRVISDSQGMFHMHILWYFDVQANSISMVGVTVSERQNFKQ